MVLESLITPFKAETRPGRLFLLGLMFSSIAVFLSLWIFKSQSSMIMVFLTTMAAIPLIYNTINLEEEKDLQTQNETFLLKEHSKALQAFVYLFLGATIGFTIWYLVLSSATVNILFQAQSETINSINGRATGYATLGNELQAFSRIFFNNVKVLIFCILFAFIYGSGGIFILMWNASVIAAALGNGIRTELTRAAQLLGMEQMSSYFYILSYSLFRYWIHGIPEILAYFVGGLAGGIIGIAVIRHDFKTKKFETVLLDSADLILISLGILFVAAILEVFITPLLFGSV